MNANIEIQAPGSKSDFTQSLISRLKARQAKLRVEVDGPKNSYYTGIARGHPPTPEERSFHYWTHKWINSGDAAIEFQI